MPTSHFRLAIASSRQFPGIHADDIHLAATLERLGVACTVCVWNDPQMDWTAFDAVLIRTIWDYFEHYAAFLAWLDMLERLSVTTINDTRTLRWNSDKRYLLELERQGVPVIPTQVAQGGNLQEALSSMSDRDVVVKPTVSGGAWHTVRGKGGTADFDQACARLPKELDYLVQPFVPEIASNGEWSLMYFDDMYSHAVLKRPTAGDYRVQEQHGGSIAPAAPDDTIVQAASKTLAATAALGHRELAYARVDGVVVNGQFLVMELEVIEPSLFLTERPDAAERFAQHLVERLQRRANGQRRLG
ncbi:RimK family alpha-L-glutamate ligase [Dyella humi]|uniref:ATP-grasp domain-containing protein n=1 Tax=Dyella humi TaxID=1770547 RepID=A0ABW8IQH7_9GAMM